MEEDYKRIRNFGNSKGVVFPAEFLRKLKLTAGDQVLIVAGKECMIVIPNTHRGQLWRDRHLVGDRELIKEIID